MPAKILKPPFGWFGGKEKIIHVLLPHVPTHDAYLEPFFGQARFSSQSVHPE